MLLERAHIFCVKYMQGLSIRSRTGAALSLLGIYSIESEIDFRKLTLFGQFCRNISNCWVHDCFYRRLASFTINNASQKGYIPDIFKIMEKYGLTVHFNIYEKTNTFPSKIRSKHLVKHRIHERDLSSWKTRLSAPEFDRFRLLHTEYSPHVLWIYSKENCCYLAASISCVHMIAKVVGNPFCNPVSCTQCSTNYDNVVDSQYYGMLYNNSVVTFAHILGVWTKHFSL